MEGTTECAMVSQTMTSSHGQANGARASRHLRVVPPSANWYCSQICDWGYDARNHRWLVVFGAKHCLVVYEFDEARELSPTDASLLEDTLRKPPRLAFVTEIPRGKKDRRVEAVRCLHSMHGDLRVLCAGEEGAVQIWDVAERTMVHQHRKHSVEVTAVVVRSEMDPNVVLAGDRQGLLSVWHRDTGQVNLFTPVTGDGVFAMDMAPHDTTLVAVGYRSGVLCVIDWVTQSVKYRLDGHDQEVHCVAWRISPKWFDSSEKEIGQGEHKEQSRLSHRRCAVLASSSRDRTIKIWHFGDNPSDEPTLTNTFQIPKSKLASSYNQSKRLWLPIAWSNYQGCDGSNDEAEFRLWSGSFEGNLMLWAWSEFSQSASSSFVKPTIMKSNAHNRLVFSIVPTTIAAQIVADVEQVSLTPLLLTVSLDREIRVWREEEASKSVPSRLVCLERIQGIGGHVYSLSYNPETNVILAGIGDQTIRLWQLNNRTSPYQTEILWKGLQSKITSVAWHPLQPHVLAYGTEDGRVGVCDLNTKSNTRLKIPHKGSVDTLEWRVCPDNEGSTRKQEGLSTPFAKAMEALQKAQDDGQSLEDALLVQEKQGKHDSSRQTSKVTISLWSRDETGLLFQTDAESTGRATQKLHSGCTSFACGSTARDLAIGQKAGSIEMCSLIASVDDTAEPRSSSTITLPSYLKIHEHTDEITCLAWSNAICGESADTLLASGGKQGQLFVYAGLRRQHPSVERPPPPRYKPIPGYGPQVVAKFHGHRAAVTCLRWSPDVKVDILASSSADGTVHVWDMDTQACRASFRHHIGRVISAAWISSSIIVSGSEDQSLRIWEYTSHRPQLEGGRAPNAIKKKPAHARDTSHGNTTVAVAGKVDSAAKLSVIASNSAPECSPNAKKPAQKSKEPMSFFHEARRLSVGDLRDSLARMNLAEPQTNTHGDQRDIMDEFQEGNNSPPMLRFIESEKHAFEQEGEWEHLARLCLFEGRIGDALRIVAKENVLTAEWVSYAPMAGLEVWREITNLYALQLETTGDMKNAACQFLSLGKVDSAVNCLRKGTMFREAIALLRSRRGLEATDNTMQAVLWEYAEHLAHSRNQIVAAAQVYLSIGTLEAKSLAVRVLASASDLKCQELALTIWQGMKTSIPRSPIVTDNDNVRDHLSDDHAGALTLPSSFFVSVASAALREFDFDFAEKAMDGLIFHQPPELSKAQRSIQTVYQLATCVIRLAKLLTNLRLNGTKNEAGMGPWHSEVLPDATNTGETHELVAFFQAMPAVSPWDEMVCSDIVPPGTTTMLATNELELRATYFWRKVFDMWRQCFASSLEKAPAMLDDVQDQLMDPHAFDFLFASTANGHGEATEQLVNLVRASRCVLKIVVELSNGYLLSALEEIQTLLTSPKSNATREPCGYSLQTLDVATLMFPRGALDVTSPPVLGELGDEAQDTKTLWHSFLVMQCEAALDFPRHIANDGLPMEVITKLRHLINTAASSDVGKTDRVQQLEKRMDYLIQNEASLCEEDKSDTPRTVANQDAKDLQGEQERVVADSKSV